MNGDYPDLAIAAKTINGKPMFEIEVKTIINFDTAFVHKKLCTVATFSLGSACAFSCTYCYVEAIVRKHPAVVKLMKYLATRGLKFHEVVVIRIAALDILREQLTFKKPKNVDLQAPGVIYTSPLVDPAGNLSLAKQTAEACSIILELTAWDIRVLSKSNLLPEIARLIPTRHRHRMIYGVSTGTLDDSLSESTPKSSCRRRCRRSRCSWEMFGRVMGRLLYSTPLGEAIHFPVRNCGSRYSRKMSTTGNTSWTAAELAKRWGVHPASVLRIMRRFGSDGIKFGHAKQAARRYADHDVKCVEKLAALKTRPISDS